MLQMSLALATLFRRYDFSIESGFEMEFLPSFTLCPKNGLRLHVARRSESLMPVAKPITPLTESRSVRAETVGQSRDGCTLKISRQEVAMAGPVGGSVLRLMHSMISLPISSIALLGELLQNWYRR